LKTIDLETSAVLHCFRVFANTLQTAQEADPHKDGVYASGTTGPTNF